MSIFPVTDELMPDAKKPSGMNEDFAALMPKEFAGAINMMAHPVASAAAFSALSLGVASHAFGVWVGVVSGAVETSHRLFMPFLDETRAEAFADKSKTPATRARAATKTLIADIQAVTREVSGETVKPASPAVAEVVKLAKRTRKAPSAADIQKAAAAKPAASRAGEAVAETPAVLKATESTGLLPEDFRQPKAMDKPRTPDDLKLISGIGPKLETVLNGLGIWTYAQIAAWNAREIGWVDDYLSFKGRIDRDGWIEQAAGFARGAGKPAKGGH